MSSLQTQNERTNVDFLRLAPVGVHTLLGSKRLPYMGLTHFLQLADRKHLKNSAHISAKTHIGSFLMTKCWFQSILAAKNNSKCAMNPSLR